MMIKQIILILTLFAFSPFLFCQLQVKNYFSFTGKKDVSVNCIAQDDLGFLWVGTNDGLYKFDGKTSVNFIKENASLKKEITSVFIDQQQTVWIGTKAGKVFTLKHNTLDSLQFGTTPNEEKITSFAELNSVIYIGTYGNGLFTFSNNLLKHYTSENGLGDNVIYNLLAGNKNMVWCCTDGGITQINDEKTTFSFKLISDKTGLPDNIVRNVTLCENRLVIAMQDSGACYYNLSTNAIERIPFFNTWTLGTVLNARSEIPEKLIITTEKNGLIVISKGKFSIYDYVTQLQSTTVNSIFFDHSNQIWIASKKGISQFFSKRYNFINIANGLMDDKVLAISTDNDNTIWIGTTLGISKIMTNGEGKLVIDKVQDLTKYTISCATKAPDGNIWFGTYGDGLIISNSKSKKTYTINSKNNTLPNDNISNIYFAGSNTLYISTLGGGLIKATLNFENLPQSFKIEKTYTQADGLGSDYVYSAITDNNGKLYVATDGGGLQVLENNKLVSLTEKFKFNSKTSYSLCKDKYNTIWATSNADGIIKFDGKSLISINIKSGLRDEQPQQLIAYDNTIFAISSKGIDKIDCKTNSISYFDIFDGDLEPNLNAVCIKDEIFYSGTNNGVLIFRTNKNLLDSLKPSAFIRSFQINYKDFPLDSAVEFKYNQNNMTFNFNGIWLKNPDKLSYRYKLDGFETQWLYSNDGKVVNYNNLSPGSYTFIVQAKNEEDVWSDETTYSFNILTPIWKRWWFWVLVAIVGSFIIYSFVKYRLKALQKENVLLEQRVTERTFEIEKQSKIIEAKNVELEQLSLVASRTDNVVLIMDAEGRLEYVNESFVKLNKVSLEELKRDIGETIFEISNNPDIKTIVAEAVYHKRSVNYEALNKFDDGAEIWESSTLTPIFDDAGVLKKIIIIDTDVTDRKKQEQIIFQKNKDITDSISYARKIQHAILPEDSLIKKYLPQSFVFYLTKDIVSGDFYWFTHINGCSIIAAVDCTGHGVPGAFMSLIGYNILNRIVNEQKITDPKDILFELNKGVLEALYKNESESKDGMDIAVCKIDHANKTIDYAGAMRPLWIVKGDVHTEIKADKIPIGTKPEEREDGIAFTTHTIHASAEDTFYIFTDGYADQFGGENNKKLGTRKFKELIIKNHTENFNVQENNFKLAHQQWKNNNEQVDDILVIGFKV